MTTQNFSKREYQILISETTSMPEKSLNICDGKHLLYSPDYNITMIIFTADVFHSYIMLWRASRFTLCIFNFIFSLLSRHLTTYQVDWTMALRWSKCRASEAPHLTEPRFSRIPPLFGQPTFYLTVPWLKHPAEQLDVQNNSNLHLFFCHTSIYRAVFARSEDLEILSISGVYLSEAEMPWGNGFGTQSSFSASFQICFSTWR